MHQGCELSEMWQRAIVTVTLVSSFCCHPQREKDVLPRACVSVCDMKPAAWDALYADWFCTTRRLVRAAEYFGHGGTTVAKCVRYDNQVDAADRKTAASEEKLKFTRDTRDSSRGRGCRRLQKTSSTAFPAAVLRMLQAIGCDDYWGI